MHGALEYLIRFGSYELIFAGLVAAGLGVPITEDVYLLASGVLAQRGLVSLPAIFTVCCVGVLIGDLTIFTIARRLGNAALDRGWFRRFLTPERRARIERLVDRRGGLIIFGARQVPGLRAPTFAVAAIHGMRLWVFVFWDVLALCISAPLFFGLGYLFSDQIEKVRRGVESARYVLTGVSLALVVAAVVTWALWKRAGRRVCRPGPPTGRQTGAPGESGARNGEETRDGGRDS